MGRGYGLLPLPRPYPCRHFTFPSPHSGPSVPPSALPGNKADLWMHCLISRSRDVIGHVSIRFPIYHLLLVVYWYWASICNGLQDVSVFLYLGHDFDLLGSRDVIGHKPFRLPTCYFLLMVLCNQASTSNRFFSRIEIFGCKAPALCKSSLRMCDITWPVPLCKIRVHILISHPHIFSSLWHFYWTPMKNRGCLGLLLKS